MGLKEYNGGMGIGEYGWKNRVQGNKSWGMEMRKWVGRMKMWEWTWEIYGWWNRYGDWGWRNGMGQWRMETGMG